MRLHGMPTLATSRWTQLNGTSLARQLQRLGAVTVVPIGRLGDIYMGLALETLLNATAALKLSLRTQSLYL
jgi:hypothetical protein